MPLPRLNPAHALGTIAAVSPSLRFLSPSIGLLARIVDAPVLKLLQSPADAPEGSGLATASALARELFYDAGAGSSVRPCANRSAPATHLSVAQLGAVAGLALRGVGDADLRRGLRAVGISTNRVNGDWTGVSMARFVRLAALVREAGASDAGRRLAVPVFLRLVWERAESKACILAFLDSIHAQGVPVLAPALVPSSSGASHSARAAFVDAAFSPADLSPQAAQRAVALVAADATTDDLSLELLAACVARAHAYKPAVRLRRHTLPVPGAREVPDCVEVSLREALDLLLWDPTRGCLDTDRLPRDCAPALRSFYAARPDPATSGGAEVSAEWFALCQHLPGCEYLKEAAAYTAATGGGGGGSGGEPLKYELRPSLRSLARAAGALLHPGAPRPWDSLADLARFWNGRGDGDGSRVTVDLRVDASRGAATEEVVRREYAVIRVWPPRAASAAGDATDAPPHSIEICLDPARHTATATHMLEGAGWLGQEARAAHSRLWLAGTRSSSADPVLSALQAPLLGDGMLEALQRGGGGRGAWEQAVLFARWGDGDATRWAPLQEGACAINASSADVRRAARRQAGLLVRAVDTAAERGGAALLPWLLRGGASAVPLQPAAIAAALLRAPPEARGSAAFWVVLEGAADVVPVGSGPPALSPVPGGALVAALVRLQDASARGGWRALSACLAVELERAAKGDGPGWPRGSVRVLLEQAAGELLRRHLPG